MKIIDNDYQESLKLYYKAFKAVPRGFAQDFYNASMCAIKLKQYDIAFIMLDSLIAKGVKKSFFERAKALEPLKQLKQWNFFITTFDMKYQKWNQDKNIKLKQILNGIAYADQEFRSKEGSYRVYEDTIRKGDKINVKILLHMIEKYGFPNENLIGVDNPLDNDIPGEIVILHQFQKLSTGIHDFDFTDIVKNAAKKGELTIHKMADWIAFVDKPELFLGGSSIYQMVYGEKKSKFLVPKLDPETKAIVNQRRLSLGLESLDDYYKKAIFEFMPKEIKEFQFSNCSLDILQQDKDFKDILPIFEYVKQ